MRTTMLSGSPPELARYEGAAHGFAPEPTRPSYRTGDVTDAWRRALGLLPP